MGRALSCQSEVTEDVIGQGSQMLKFTFCDRMFVFKRGLQIFPNFRTFSMISTSRNSKKMKDTTHDVFIKTGLAENSLSDKS